MWAENKGTEVTKETKNCLRNREKYRRKRGKQKRNKKEIYYY
jgi:hypothetical protein